ncbi:hypothetical protein Tco_0630898 [Tanacetum coccineum]
MVSNQIRPPGFPPIQNPHSNSQNNFNREITQSKQGNNFNARIRFIDLRFTQTSTHQGPAPQTHGVSKIFERYVTANDAYEKHAKPSFEITYRCLDAHPKFASTVKTLIGNKEKLRANCNNTFLNETVFQRLIPQQVTKKLGDPADSDSMMNLTGTTTSTHWPIMVAAIISLPYYVKEQSISYLILDSDLHDTRTS